MLILTRSTKPYEDAVTVRTVDGVLVRVVVLEVRGKLVRLGFETPRSTVILRDELLPPALLTRPTEPTPPEGPPWDEAP